MTRASSATLSRVFFAPVFLLLYTLPSWAAGTETFSALAIIPLFALAEFTDFLDGFWARKDGTVSGFGKIFDPFADVMLNLTAFLAFTVTGLMPPLIFAFLLYREFTMTFLRAVCAEKGLAIGARKGGKAKTLFYVLAISWTLLGECLTRLGVAENLPGLWRPVSLGLFGICLLLAYASLGDYLFHFKDILWKKNAKNAA